MATTNSDHDDDRPRGNARSVPVAPPDAPPTGRLMQPVPAVSAEIAELLPPVGLLGRPPAPPPPAAPLGPTQPTPRPRPVVGPKQHSSLVRSGAVPGRQQSAGLSSAVMTLLLVLTATGVGAMAILPALNRRNEPSTVHGRQPDLSPPPDDRSGGAIEEDADIGSSEKLESAPLKVPNSGPDSRPSRSAPAGNAEKLEAELESIMRHLRQRDVAAANERMAQLAAQDWPRHLVPRLQRYGALVDEIGLFLTGLQEGIDQAKAGRTINWRGRKAPIVDKTDTSVTILVDRQHVKLRRDSLSDQAVRALAEAVLDMEDPRNQVQLGAFLLLTEDADREEIRRLWNEAAMAGEDVSLLLPFLQLPP